MGNRYSPPSLPLPCPFCQRPTLLFQANRERQYRDCPECGRIKITSSGEASKVKQRPRQDDKICPECGKPCRKFIRSKCPACYAREDYALRGKWLRSGKRRYPETTEPGEFRPMSIEEFESQWEPQFNEGRRLKDYDKDYRQRDYERERDPFAL